MSHNSNANVQHYGAAHIQFNVLPTQEQKLFHVIAWLTTNGQILARYTTKDLELAQAQVEYVLQRAHTRTPRTEAIEITIFESESNRFITRQHPLVASEEN